MMSVAGVTGCRRPWRNAAAALLSACAFAGPAFADNPCGEIYLRHYGPYDYRTDQDKLHIVEVSHFTPDIEALIGSEWNVAGNLNYTLKAAPNHHRALLAVVRFGEKMKTSKTEHLDFTVECFFDRAVRFRPDDTVVRALYAQYLGKHGRKAEAVKQLEVGVSYSGDNALSHYNAGLVYFDLGEYDRALAQARRARELGLDRTELADELKRIGRVLEPMPAASGASDAH